MPKFDEKLKEEVRKEDGNRCQICGRGPQEDEAILNVHHVFENRGMGSKEYVNVKENLITLCTSCHEKVHSRKFNIEKFDRENKILEISDETFHIITRDSKSLKKLLGVSALYFHNKQLFDILSEAQERVARKVRAEREDARDLWSLRLNDAFGLLDPTAKSFQDYTLSQGWSPNRASRFASLWEQSESGDIKWDVGESATDYSRRLKAAGVVKSQTFWYAILDLDHDKFRLVRTQEVDKLRESMNDGEALVRLGKFEFGLHFKIDEGLSNWSGKPIKYDIL